MEPVTLSFVDRLQFGGISAFFGLVVGCLIALIVMVLSYAVAEGGWPFNTRLVGFSGVFFFMVGVIRGPDAAETVVDGLVASAVIVLGGIGICGGGQTIDGEYGWRQSMWWPVTFFSGVALVGWLA